MSASETEKTDFARHKRDSESFGRMDTPVHDVARMAAATAMIVDAFMREQIASGHSDYTAAEFAHHMEPWSDAVDFMVHHLRDMADELKSFYT